MSGDPAGILITAIAGLLYAGFRKLMEANYERRERQKPDRRLERDVKAAVERVPDGLSLSVRRRTGAGGRCARLAVGGVCSLDIGPETGGDIDVGDEAVDDLFALRGPRSLVCALMDGDTRSLLMDLARMPEVRPGSVRMAAGTLRVDVLRPRFRPTMQRTVVVTRKALALAQRLQTPVDVPARLSANVLNDPERGVRQASLRVLLHQYPDEWATRETLRLATNHADSELRLMAALALGADGVRVLADLAGDADADDVSSAGAIEALRTLPLSELERILRGSLRRNPQGLLPARPSTARACADALATCGDAGVPLLADVVRASSAAVALAGVRALRRIGTVEAVLPLTQAAESGEDAVRRAARAALEDIQAGLAGSRGAVSLAGGDAGTLSLADDPSGRVSLTAHTPKGS